MAGENGSRSEEKHRKKKRRKDNEKATKDTPTVSIAIAGSIIDNAQSLELATRLAGQIARCATIFRIDEVVVFDSESSSPDNSVVTTAEDADGNESGARFLVRILQYLETPQYLRRRLFPMHNNLKFVGLLPPLDAPHHVRKHEWSPFREGITLKENSSVSKGTLVDVGLSKNVMVEQVLEPGLRVTVAMGSDRNIETDCVKSVVTPMSPREEMGLYWGYRVRYASNLSCVFKGCPFKGGYDHMIGTSEHGLVVSSSELMIPTFRHLLIAFGGLAGLEESIEEDNDLKGNDPRDLFNCYLNICPNQGSRTIRTEEAIFISLQYFQEPIKKAQQRLEK
ncbi:putative methyltransferase C9orf114-like protein isoform X1 [Iris pallida]|uniref:Methyltransferase C9orf114-like protein isoform X1 n=1 Tax=Iris pallida TaxID=29817 RepID=A0AAX6EFK4_IRIPA|nr:putative methyltransferase C9orf114-like protein isoform X1 [Iris pallida]